MKIKKIAKLAKIGLSSQEEAQYEFEIGKILNWTEQLNEVNTDDTEPMYSVISSGARLREDIATAENYKDAVTINAPNSKYGYFVVPKVIE